MKRTPWILVVLLLLSCKKAPPTNSNLAVTNSKPVTDPKDAPGAVMLHFFDEKGGVSQGSGVRRNGQIYTSAHVVNGNFEEVLITDYAKKPIGRFTLHSPDVRVHKDSRYKGDVTDPHDRAALIFQGRGLENLDKGMEHYGKYKSTDFANKPFDAKGQYRTVGGGPADYAYKSPNGEDPTLEQIKEFETKGLSAQLRMTDSDGSNFRPSQDADLGEYRGYPYQNGPKPLTNTPPNGQFGVTMPGDSGGPVYEINPDGSMGVVGLTQNGGYTMPVYSEEQYKPVRNENGFIDYYNTPGGINNYGKTYRYPETFDASKTGEVYKWGSANAGFNSSSSGSFQGFVSEVDGISEKGW